MSDIDQQFIEYVVKSLVGKPEAVHIDRRIDEKGVLLELTVDPEDLGRVIGKRGATAQSLRTLLRALGTKNDARYNLKIMDNGLGGGQAPSNDDSDGADAGSPAKNDNADTSDDTSPVTSETPIPGSSPTESVPAKPVDFPPKNSDEKATETPEDQASDRLRQTRAELADLDDLDV